jgi:ribosomal protein L40E
MGAERITAGFRAAHKIAQIKALQGIARTSGRLLAAPIRAPIREIGIIRRVYQAERAGGLPRRRALGRAIGGYIWRLPGRMGRRIRTGIVGEAREAREIGEILSKSIFGTRKGMVGAIRDVAEALGLPKKEKKERATCTRCGNFVPEGAAHCPHCGLRMPTCPQGHLTTPGAAFCHRCGSKIP